MSHNYSAVSRPAGEYYDEIHNGLVGKTSAAATIRQAILYSTPGVSIYNLHGIMCPSDVTTRKMWHQFLTDAYPLTTTERYEGAEYLPGGEFETDEDGIQKNILNHSFHETKYPYVFPGWIQRQCRKYGGEETANINILAYLVEWCSFHYRKTNSKGNFKYSIKDVSNSNKKPLTPNLTEPIWKYCVQYAVRNIPTHKEVIWDDSWPIMEHATVAINSGTYDEKIFYGAWTDEDSNDLIMSTPNCAALNAYKVEVGEGATTEKESQEEESKPVGKVKSRVITPECVRVFGNYSAAINALGLDEPPNKKVKPPQRVQEDTTPEESGNSDEVDEEIPERLRPAVEFYMGLPWQIQLFTLVLLGVAPFVLLVIFMSALGFLF